MWYNARLRVCGWICEGNQIQGHNFIVFFFCKGTISLQFWPIFWLCHQTFSDSDYNDILWYIFSFLDTIGVIILMFSPVLNNEGDPAWFGLSPNWEKEERLWSKVQVSQWRSEFDYEVSCLLWIVVKRSFRLILLQKVILLIFTFLFCLLLFSLFYLKYF